MIEKDIRPQVEINRREDEVREEQTDFEWQIQTIADIASYYRAATLPIAVDPGAADLVEQWKAADTRLEKLKRGLVRTMTANKDDKEYIAKCEAAWDEKCQQSILAKQQMLNCWEPTFKTRMWSH